MTEPTDKDLLKAEKGSLENVGRLESFKVELTTDVMSTLNRHSADKEHPKIPEQLNLNFINDVVREYLTWNGYNCTEQMLTAESNSSKEGLDRETLADTLEIIDTPKAREIPLLYFIVSALDGYEKGHTLTADVL